MKGIYTSTIEDPDILAGADGCMDTYTVLCILILIIVLFFIFTLKK